MPERLGFTGTRQGMTREQLATLRIVLRKHAGWWLSHGDCVGADEQLHHVAHGLGFDDDSIWIHPPEEDRLRAFCGAPPGRIFRPRPYKIRNMEIADLCARLVAAPAEASEQRRGGTWFTVRYARHLGRPIKIILPNGRVRNEGWPT